MNADLSLAQSCGDALLFGTIVCDAQARVLYANKAAEKLARAGAGLSFRASDRSLSALIDNKRMTDLIAAACEKLEAGSIVLADSNRVPALIVLIKPLLSNERQASAQRYALLAIRCMNAPAPFDESRLVALFKLSPAQASLALALYEGKSFEEIAVARNVKVTTLRTHFAEVLNRTGATGLRDLTRRLGMIPPLR